MAIVNIDLSEYDTIRSRVKELEEQVNELKKVNEGLKSSTKVILRKETQVVRYRPGIERDLDGHGKGFVIKPEIHKTTETSESFINFEDVRQKVENQMREEVERSIKENKEAYRRYSERYNTLEAEFQKKTEDMEKSCRETLRKKNDEFRDSYKETVDRLERKTNLLLTYLSEIDKLVDKAIWTLDNNIFFVGKTKKILQIIKGKTQV